MKPGSERCYFMKPGSERCYSGHSRLILEGERCYSGHAREKDLLQKFEKFRKNLG